MCNIHLFIFICLGIGQETEGRRGCHAITRGRYQGVPSPPPPPPLPDLQEGVSMEGVPDSIYSSFSRAAQGGTMPGADIRGPREPQLVPPAYETGSQIPQYVHLHLSRDRGGGSAMLSPGADIRGSRATAGGNNASFPRIRLKV